MRDASESIRNFVISSGFVRRLFSLDTAELADLRADLVEAAELFADARCAEDAGRAGGRMQRKAVDLRESAIAIAGAGVWRSTVTALAARLASIELDHRRYGEPSAEEVLAGVLDWLGVAPEREVVATIEVTAGMRDEAIDALRSLRPDISREDAKRAVHLAIAYAATENGFMDRCLDGDLLAEVYEQNVEDASIEAPAPWGAPEMDNGEESHDGR